MVRELSCKTGTECSCNILTLSQTLVANGGLADEPSAVNVAGIPPRADEMTLILEVRNPLGHHCLNRDAKHNLIQCLSDIMTTSGHGQKIVTDR